MTDLSVLWRRAMSEMKSAQLLATWTSSDRGVARSKGMIVHDHNLPGCMRIM